MAHAGAWLLFCLPLAAAPGAPPQAARVRLLHASPREQALTAYFDGAAARVLAPGDLGDYATVSPGSHRVTLFDGDGAPLDDREASFEAGFDYTIAIVGEPPRLLRIRDRTIADDRRSYVRLVNLVPESGDLVLTPQGDPALGTVAFGQAMRPAAVTAATYTFVLTAADDGRVMLTSEPVECPAGVTISLFLVPGPGGSRLLVDRQQAPGGRAYLPAAPGPAAADPLPLARAMNAAPGLPPLDFRLGDRLLARGVGYGQATEFATVEPGPSVFRIGRGDEALQATDLELIAGRCYTLVACAAGGHVTLWPIDELPAPADAPTALRIANAVADLPNAVVELEGAGEWRQHVPFLGLTAHVEVPETATGQRFVIRRPGEDTVLRTVEARLERGVRYTMVLLGRLAPSDGGPGLSAELLREAAR